MGLAGKWHIAASRLSCHVQEGVLLETPTSDFETDFIAMLPEHC